MIQNNVIHAAHQSGIQKLLFLGSNCIYPREMTRSDLEEAKRDELCQRAGFQVFNHSE